jgi:ATP synthase protein I
VKPVRVRRVVLQKRITVAGPQKQDPEDRYSAARTVGAGVLVPGMLFGCVVVGVVLGYFIDKWLGSNPWGLLVGLVIGSVAGVREMLKLLKKMQGENRK